MLTIDKNIPLPASSRLGTTLATCRAMEIGDSFFMSTKTRPNLMKAESKTGRKFAIRRDGTGWRVWRTA